MVPTSPTPIVSPILLQTPRMSFRNLLRTKTAQCTIGLGLAIIARDSYWKGWLKEAVLGLKEAVSPG